MLTGLYAHAQTLEIVDSNPANHYVVEPVELGMWPPQQLHWNCRLYNSGPDSVHVIVSRESIQFPTGMQEFFTWNQGHYPPIVDTVSIYDNIAIGPGDTSYLDGNPILWSTLEPNEHSGIAVIRYCFMDTGDFSNAVCVDVTYVVIPGTLSVDENTAQIDVSQAYPNPASDQVQLAFSGMPQGQSAIVQVYNSVGVRVESTQVVESDGPVRINTASYPQGIYFAVIEHNSKLIIKRFEVIR